MHFIFGLAGSKPRLDTLEALADTIPTPRALADQDRVRGFAELRHQAQSWAGERRVCARLEATRVGSTFASWSPASRLARPNRSTPARTVGGGPAEDLIELHETRLASNRTGCRSALANQVRLALHPCAMRSRDWC